MASHELMDLKVVALDRVYARVPRETLSRWALEGRIAQADLVRPSGAEAWVSVTEVPWLAASLPQGILRDPAEATDEDPEAEVDAAAGWVARRPRQKTEEAEMDMTPMIDVTFQLLIFFMLTNSLVNPAPISVPEAAHGRGIMPDGKQVVLIDDRGRYYLGESTREENVAPSLSAVVQEVRGNAAVSDDPLDVIVTAHKAAKHVQVRELVEQLGTVPNVGQVLIGVEEKRR
jgi:biopolymer transport protein ExbD